MPSYNHHMNINELIEALDAEIARLTHARALLDGRIAGNGRTAVKRGPKPKANGTQRRTMSAEGRARIAAAQTARWAKAR
jgi:hypothetical protein